MLWDEVEFQGAMVLGTQEGLKLSAIRTHVMPGLELAFVLSRERRSSGTRIDGGGSAGACEMQESAIRRKT